MSKRAQRSYYYNDQAAKKFIHRMKKMDFTPAAGCASYGEIAADLGVTQQRAQQITMEALRKFMQRWHTMFGQAPDMEGGREKNNRAAYPATVKGWD